MRDGGNLILVDVRSRIRRLVASRPMQHRYTFWSLLAVVLGGASGRMLHEASEKGDLAKVTMLVQRGAVVDQRLKEPPWATPLMAASNRRRSAVLRVLLEAGANPNLRTSDGHSALTLAVSAGLVDSVKLLLAFGASADAADDNGESALAKAASRGNVAVVEALLEAGADPNRHSHSCVSPMHWAVHGCHGAIATLLLRHGALTSSAPTTMPSQPSRRICRAGSLPYLPPLTLSQPSECRRAIVPIDVRCQDSSLRCRIRYR